MQLFNDYYSKEGQPVQIEQVADMIRSDEALKVKTMSHQSLLAQGQDGAAKEVKKSTPQLAVSFVMEGGKEKDNCGECQDRVMIDFDAKKPGERLPADELERVKTTLRTSYHALLGYESISRLGYHIIVPFRLPEGVTIDLKNDRSRSEAIYKRAYRVIANYYSACCGHKMDMGCDNINRLAGLSHDPQVVYRADARPFCLTREELGIDKDGNLISMKTPKKAIGASGKRISVPVGNHLQAAEKMLEDSGMSFDAGHHDFVVRLSFILNRMGVDEDEAAQAVDDAYKARMHHSPSKVLHSCYKAAQSEFGAWLSQKSKNAINTEIIADFLKKKPLKYDLLTQKTLLMQENGQWTEMRDRDENSLFMECCSVSEANLALQLFRAVVDSNVVPEVNPLKDYVLSQAPWDETMPDYIAQAASQVHMCSDREDMLWATCFKKWFVAMVAGWIDEDVVNHQVIVLVGRQGIFKSTWIRRLLPPELKAYVSDMPDISRLDKDEQLRAAEFGLINLDELDKLSERELNKLKATVTAVDVNVRASYGHHKERRVRVASYAASGNKPEFLTDQTGNRRWLPFHVEHIDSPFDSHLPYAGMYAQAAYLIKNHKIDYWFDLNDIKEMEEHVEKFMAPANEEQLIRVYFSPASADDPGALFLTNAEISSKLSAYGNLRRDIDSRRLGAMLNKLGFQPSRSGHNGTRGYIVREHTPEELKQLRDPKSVFADNADVADVIF